MLFFKNQESFIITILIFFCPLAAWQVDVQSNKILLQLEEAQKQE